MFPFKSPSLDQSQPEPKPEARPAAPALSLGASLRADFEALQNDFEQASEMAAEFQRQLAGKSNEFAELKHIFEKTSGDFSRLQADIASLREERHRLANEAMRATAFEMKLTEVVGERDQLKREIAALRTAATVAQVNSKTSSDREIIERLTAELEAARQPSAPGSGGLAVDPRAVVLLAEIINSANQLRTMLGNPGANSASKIATPKQPTVKSTQLDDFIDISFSA